MLTRKNCKEKNSSLYIFFQIQNSLKKAHSLDSLAYISICFHGIFWGRSNWYWDSFSNSRGSYDNKNQRSNWADRLLHATYYVHLEQYDWWGIDSEVDKISEISKIFSASWENLKNWRELVKVREIKWWFHFYAYSSEIHVVFLSSGTNHALDWNER